MLEVTTQMAVGYIIPISKNTSLKAALAHVPELSKEVGRSSRLRAARLVFSLAMLIPMGVIYMFQTTGLMKAARNLVVGPPVVASRSAPGRILKHKNNQYNMEASIN